jgi:peptide chain release factor 2
LSAVLQITGSRWNRKLDIENAHAYVYDVGEKHGYKIKELNFQKESAGIKTVTLEFEGDYSLAI